jgi:hypothetical protein
VDEGCAGWRVGLFLSTKAIPHFGHFPGAGRMTSGCIGQLYTTPASSVLASSVAAAGAGSAGDLEELFGGDSGAFGFEGSSAAGACGGSETHASAQLIAAVAPQKSNLFDRSTFIAILSTLRSNLIERSHYHAKEDLHFDRFDQVPCNAISARCN